MDLSKIYKKNGSSRVQLLPPWHQETREREAIIKAIENNPALKEKFGLDIQSFTKTENGYLLKTRLHSLKVTVEYLENEEGFCGPAQFKLVFGEVEDVLAILPTVIDIPTTPLKPSNPTIPASNIEASSTKATFRKFRIENSFLSQKS